MTVILNFHGISTEKYLYGIMFVVQGGLQGQKVNFKVIFFTNTIFNKYK